MTTFLLCAILGCVGVSAVANGLGIYSWIRAEMNGRRIQKYNEEFDRMMREAHEKAFAEGGSLKDAQRHLAEARRAAEKAKEN